MAPRVLTPKPSDDTDTSIVDNALKPKTKRAKVEKPVKADKAPKVNKPKSKPDAKSKSDKTDDGAFIESVKSEGKGLGKADGDGKGKAEKGKGKEKGKEKEEKVEKFTGEEAAELIREYLRAQNRPYSVTEVVANLRGKVTKTVADKILKELENNGEIMGKGTKPKGKDGKDLAGTQWVFWCKQEAPTETTPEDLASLSIAISTLRAHIPTLKTQHKTLLTTLSTLKSTPATSELHAMIISLRASNEMKKEKLKGFKEGTVKMVSKEEKARVEKEWRFWDGKRRVRRGVFRNLEGVLGERWSREEVWEGAGVEGDEEAY